MTRKKSTWRFKKLLKNISEETALLKKGQLSKHKWVKNRIDTSRQPHL